MEIIESPQMPPAGGHYSTCIEHNGVLYVSGQLPRNPVDRTIPEGISAQTHLVLSNLKLILHEAGSDLNNVLQMRIYIPDVNMWDEVNRIYAEYFSEHKPARCVVPTRELHHGCLVEMECVSVIISE